MKIKVNYDKLSKGLLYTIKGVSLKPNIPVLSNVLLNAKDNGLFIVTTNLETMIKMWIPGIVEEEGSTTVSAKFLTDFILASKSDNVSIELNDTVVKVITDVSKATFLTIPTSEFPPVTDKTDSNKLFSIDAKDFVESIEKVSFACSTDYSIGKIQQTGIFIDMREDEFIDFVGLDGIRLSIRSCKVFDLNTDLLQKGFIVPSKYLLELSKIVSDYGDVERVDFFIDSSFTQLTAKVEDLQLDIRLIEGEYPNFRKIIPTEKILTIKIPKKKMEDALKVISTFAKSSLSFKTNFDFYVENLEIVMSSSVSDIGENESRIEVESLLGESNFFTAYNLKLLQEAVNHIKSDFILFESNGPLTPTVLKDIDDKNFMHLLMPLRRD